MKSFYRGVAIIGGENNAGIYSVNGGIIDAQGVGLQHLFYKSYEQDLIHTACTMLKIDGILYYGNKVYDGKSHPEYISPDNSENADGFIFKDEFSYPNIMVKKTDEVFSYEDNIIGFQTNVLNNSSKVLEIELYAYSISRNNNKDFLCCSYDIENKILLSKNGDRVIGIKIEKPEIYKIVEDSPTGFMYRSTQALIYNESHLKELTTKSMAGLLLGTRIKLEPKQSYTFKWCLIAEENEDKIKNQLKDFELSKMKENAKIYWINWLSRGNKLEFNNEIYRKYEQINLITIKAACINGYIPADLTGHYFSDGTPCYYARDSMMTAKAFFLSGHYEEFEKIIKYLTERPKKENGEFYQRYNGMGIPSEGANNDVFHQLDSIGYFIRNIRNYYFKTGKLLIDYDDFKKYINILLVNKNKNGMLGPEGGVNEGVFGPAYITSSNMVIYGALLGAIEIAAIYKDKVNEDKWELLSKEIYKGIQSTFSEENERYFYGYVEYNNDLVKKYDTPQYFGPLYGYPNDERMKKNNKFYLKHAVFYKDGIGYSEQEYHHGPWIFNTAACAEYCLLNGEETEYKRKIKWIINHANAYGLMPEAIDGNNENKCYINPLTWACAEFISAIFINNSVK